MKTITALLLLCGLSAIQAFSSSSMKALRQSGCSRQVAPRQTSSTTVLFVAMHPRQLSEIDLMALENVAEFCLSVDSMVEECDLDEHEALVNQLSEQRNILLQ